MIIPIDFSSYSCNNQSKKGVFEFCDVIYVCPSLAVDIPIMIWNSTNTLIIKTVQ